MVAGGALALIGGATHGDLPEGSGDAALRFLADHPAYALVHFVSILGAVLWVLGMNGWQATRTKATARWLAPLGYSSRKPRPTEEKSTAHSHSHSPR